jgi:hypothetical protein
MRLIRSCRVIGVIFGLSYCEDLMRVIRVIRVLPEFLFGVIRDMQAVG